MIVFSGEQIETLLWENGLDFDHVTDDNDTPGIEVYVGDSIINVTETYVADDGLWYLDTDNLMMEKVRNSQVVKSWTTDVSDESELVLEILKQGLTLS